MKAGSKKSVRLPTTSREITGKTQEVFRWIIAGHTQHDIIEAVEKQWPGQSAKPLIVAAIKQIAESGKFDESIVVGWCFEAYRDLYRKMVEVGDHAGALRAVQLIGKLALK